VLGRRRGHLSFVSWLGARRTSCEITADPDFYCIAGSWIRCVRGGLHVCSRRGMKSTALMVCPWRHGGPLSALRSAFTTRRQSSLSIHIPHKAAAPATSGPRVRGCAGPRLRSTPSGAIPDGELEGPLRWRRFYRSMNEPALTKGSQDPPVGAGGAASAGRPAWQRPVVGRTRDSLDPTSKRAASRRRERVLASRQGVCRQ